MLGICQWYTAISLWCQEFIMLYGSSDLEIWQLLFLSLTFQPYLSLSFFLLYLWALSSLMLHWSYAYSLSSFLLHRVSIWRVCHSVSGSLTTDNFIAEIVTICSRICIYVFSNFPHIFYTFKFYILNIRLGILICTCNPST